MTLSREERTSLLREAARKRQQAARDRAEKALRELAKAGEPVNYRNVARHGGVSVDFLYSDPELRARIARLRSRGRAVPAAVVPDTHSTIILTLTAQLREARTEIARLMEALAAAHGENLTLRRNQAGASYRSAR
jgi:hypothetical protein